VFVETRSHKHYIRLFIAKPVAVEFIDCQFNGNRPNSVMSSETTARNIETFSWSSSSRTVPTTRGGIIDRTKRHLGGPPSVKCMFPRRYKPNARRRFQFCLSILYTHSHTHIYIEINLNIIEAADVQDVLKVNILIESLEFKQRRLNGIRTRQHELSWYSVRSALCLLAISKKKKPV